MTVEEFQRSLAGAALPPGLPAPLAALWWDAKGDWGKAHALVDSLENAEGMAVHAYLHRKEGDLWNADYWYQKAGKKMPHHSLEKEWEEIVEAFLE